MKCLLLHRLGSHRSGFPSKESDLGGKNLCLFAGFHFPSGFLSFESDQSLASIRKPCGNAAFKLDSLRIGLGVDGTLIKHGIQMDLLYSTKNAATGHAASMNNRPRTRKIEAC
jgi:hypothetical protein